jgi:hypothetical protein
MKITMISMSLFIPQLLVNLSILMMLLNFKFNLLIIMETCKRWITLFNYMSHLMFLIWLKLLSLKTYLLNLFLNNLKLLLGSFTINITTWSKTWPTIANSESNLLKVTFLILLMNLSNQLKWSKNYLLLTQMTNILLPFNHCTHLN